MKQQDSISKSPITNATLESFLSCIDFTVSQEKFTILKDTQLDFLVTSPRPLVKDLMLYYESENYISHTDSDKNLFDKIYQLVKRITIKSKIKKLKKAHPNATNILDVGCGTGDFLATCFKNKFAVFGIEPNKQARDIALQKMDSNSIFDSFNSLKKETNSKFDIITLWHVLEHVPNLLEYTKTLKDLLNPNGILIIAVPNFKSYDAQHYKEFWAAYDVPRHLWHFSKEAIATLFKKVDLKIVKTHPMLFDSFYVSMLSEKNNQKHFKNLRAFCIGLFSNSKALFTKEYSSCIYILKHAKKPFKAK